VLFRSVIKYDHSELSLNGKADDIISSMQLCSVWDISTEFKFRILGVDCLPPSLQKKGTSIIISMSVYCGDEVLCPTIETPPAVLNSGDIFGAVWAGSDSAVNTGLKLCDLPRATKLSFTVYSVARGKNIKKDREPVGWVNYLIYNYKHELRTGKVSLKLWPGEALPLGTCVANQTDPQAVIMKLGFPNYGDQKTVVFPTELLDYAAYPEEQFPSPGQRKTLEDIISRHSLAELSLEDKTLVWKFRKSYCINIPQSLPKFLMSVPKSDRIAIQEMHKLLALWNKFIKPVDALELLDARYADSHIRKYAVEQLEKLLNHQVEDYLLQFVQVLKYESYHDCELSRFLLKRAIRNRRVGHFLYWFLKSELHNTQVSERFGLILEAFLKGGSEARDAITAQETVISGLMEIALKAKSYVGRDLVGYIRGEIGSLNKRWPKANAQLMLDPGFITQGIVVEKCKVMDSKMKPLWLQFEVCLFLGISLFTLYRTEYQV